MKPRPARTISAEELAAAIDEVIKILDAVGDVLEQNPGLRFEILAKSTRVLSRTRAVGNDCSCGK